MSEFTAKGLVEYCKQALGWKTVYMWGGLMKTVTQAFIDYKKKQYPKYYSEARVKQLQTKIGNYYGCDCVGLIKSYLFGGINSPKYKSKWDTNTRGMYSVSKTKGTIETLPEIQGLILYMKGHVGVYIGNGECIECTLGKYGDGVVKTKVAGRGWTHWLQLPWLDYNDGVETECGCDCPCCQEKCKKKTDDLIDVWQPPLPNNGKVKVIYAYYHNEPEDFEIERYKTLVISPIRKYHGMQWRFSEFYIDNVPTKPTPMLFLDENVSEVVIFYTLLDLGEFGAVIDMIKSDGIWLKNYLPQVASVGFNYKSIPRGTIYKGFIVEGTSFDMRVFVFPVDLDKNEFKVELNFVIYTLRLNRSNLSERGKFRYCFFDLIKAQFGEGLSSLHSESYVELKPKGV